MRLLFFFMLITSGFTGCSHTLETTSYPLHVGDISYIPSIDRMDASPCNPEHIIQYYALDESGPINEKNALVKHILTQYKQPPLKGVDGYITIRFIINCQGEAGRFRVEEMGADYQKMAFPTQIKEDLLRLIKTYPSWKSGKYNGNEYDYYYYLSFKLKDAQLKDIMP